MYDNHGRNNSLCRLMAENKHVLILQLWNFLVFKFREHVKCYCYLLSWWSWERTSGDEPRSGQDAALFTCDL